MTLAFHILGNVFFTLKSRSKSIVYIQTSYPILYGNQQLPHRNNSKAMELLSHSEMSHQIRGNTLQVKYYIVHRWPPFCEFLINQTNTLHCTPGQNTVCAHSIIMIGLSVTMRMLEPTQRFGQRNWLQLGFKPIKIIQVPHMWDLIKEQCVAGTPINKVADADLYLV